ncbi:MAG: sulfatase-like hydrolase/transferase, partial [candidate division Zixibacteria bacterium]|nr:sulfatase-like hydrolase/transferase [candidate division Zixibacteria bacterium]
MAVKTRYISNLTLFYLLSLVTLTLFFELWRLILLVQLRDLAEGVPLAVLAGSFAVGWRFDFAVSSYILLPIVLLGSLPWLDISRNRYIRWFNLLLLYLLVAAAFFATLVDIEFFRAFNTRLNGMALQWNNTPGIAASMIWEMYPVVRYFLLYFVILWGFIAVVRHWLRDLVINRKPSPVLTNVLYLLPLLGLLLLGARGRVDVKTPLTWGAAYFCEYDFANQLALNPNFTFMRDVAYDSGKWRRAERLISGIYNPRAEHIVYGLLGIPDTTAIGGRMHRQVRFQPQNNDPANVILIIMESFGSSRIGCLNEQVPYDLSPHFDAMAEHSLLFTNFYSSGMHTSSGVFSTLYGAPIMLGRNLMKHMAGQNRFWGLPNILREHGYRTLFFVPHDPHVDNLQGFLKANGMTRVYAVADYDDDRRIGTWGVPDHVMFDYAYAFLSRIKDERFFATLLTVSNHGPWQVPDVPFAPLPDEIPGHKE